MIARLNRRQALLGGAGLALAGLALPSAARAGNDYTDALTAFTGGAEPVRGRIALDLPEVAENGNAVPMSVSVESPMTAEDHVEAVLILASKNPQPGVATFRFSPASGRAAVSTRIRLLESQEVIAVARMSDGSHYIDRKRVMVTLGGCTG
jgi:sulfur-oxidizing protein SoxY